MSRNSYRSVTRDVIRAVYRDFDSDFIDPETDNTITNPDNAQNIQNPDNSENITVP